MRCALLLLLLALPVGAQEIRIDQDGPDNLPESPDNNLEGDLSQQNSNNNNSTTTYNGNAPRSMPTSTAVAPSLISTGVQSCLKSTSNGVQGFSFGLSRGTYQQDPFCNRRANALVLSQLGLKISAVSLMCQDPDVYKAMMVSGSPCPLVERGKIVVGRRSYLKLKENPELHIPMYAENKAYYDAILGVGEEVDVEEVDTGNLSDRFRASEIE
tara:strand:+ start:2576 stop:3214 length:639 start_codon:yes stop_codon:yes gene_type:complete